MPATNNQRLSVSGLRVEVAGRTLVDDFDFELDAGETVALLGKNGAGKTLLLHTLAGLREAAGGEIHLSGEPLAALPRRTLARRLALLPQGSDDVFPATVLETVLIGRHPHIDLMGWESDADLGIARDALAAVDLLDLEGRDVLTLSGGERQRLAIAQCLTQDATMMLLDEPTNHLDPHHQVDVLELLKAQADDGRAVLMALHDVNYAAHFTDRCVLLYGNGEYDVGDTGAILDADRLERLYGTAIDAVPFNGKRVFVPAFR